MDPLNYASVDLSIEVFDYALATHGLNKPIKMICCWISAASYLFSQYEFLMLYNTWVLMMDPLNYALLDQSIEAFEGALATQGLNKPLKNDMLLNFYLFIQKWFFMLYNTWVLMMDPLNYALVDQSLEAFEGALATQGLNKPIKFDMLLNFSCFLPFLHNMNF